MAEQLGQKLRSRGLARPQRPPVPIMPLPTDEEYWNILPDILQAQITVAIQSRARRSKGACEPEVLLWAGTPYLRTNKILLLFMIWVVVLLVPVFLLTEVVEHGGWMALGWAVVSVFIFVPKISRSSREVYALTTCRVFASTRTMYCSITTDQLDYGDVTAAKLHFNSDLTATLTLESTLDRQRDEFKPIKRVTLDRLKDVKDVCRVLSQYLPAEIAESAGISASS